MNLERVYGMIFADVYPLLVAKAERKGRTKDEVDILIFWLTGYDDVGLRTQLEKRVDMQTFYNQAPQINTHASKITGVICGCRVEEITDPIYQKVRWLDKLVDELSKGKTIEKILRK